MKAIFEHIRAESKEREGARNYGTKFHRSRSLFFENFRNRTIFRLLSQDTFPGLFTDIYEHADMYHKITPLERLDYRSAYYSGKCHTNFSRNGPIRGPTPLSFAPWELTEPLVMSCARQEAVRYGYLRIILTSNCFGRVLLFARYFISLH